MFQPINAQELKARVLEILIVMVWSTTLIGHTQTPFPDASG